MTNNTTQIDITMAEAYPLCMDILKAKLVPHLISSPGIGKSDLANQIAEKHQLCVIDMRLSSADPTDLNGFPMILKHTMDKINGKLKAGYIPMETFPIEGDPIPDGYIGWLLLLDEFNSATLAVQAAAYKLVLNKMVGMHRLHSKVAVIAAGNLATDKAIVNRLSTAMQSRLIWLCIRACPKAWIIWADTHDIDHRVKSFIKFKPDLLHKFDPNHSDLTFPCPRTWEFMSKIIKPWKSVEMEKIAVLAGTVGNGAAREFYSYTKIYGEIPEIGEILSNPEGCSFGDEPSMHYALSGLVSHHLTKDNAKQLIKFVKRLGIDFQVVTLRSAIARDNTIKHTQSVTDWITHNAQELL